MKVNLDFSILPDLVQEDVNGEYIEIYIPRIASGVKLVGTGRLYKDGKTAVLQGFKLAKVEPAVLDRYEMDPAKSKFVYLREQKSQLSECTLEKNLYFKTCSSAASFVIGNNANGWVEWVDKLGNPIDMYRYPSNYRKKRLVNSVELDCALETNEDTEDLEDVEDNLEREEESLVSEYTQRSLLDEINDYIQLTGEYGKPSGGNMSYFMSTVGQAILESETNDIEVVKEYCDNLYCETDAVYRNGFEFYEHLLNSKPRSKEDIISFIGTYEYTNNRVSTEVEIVDTKEIKIEAVESQEIKVEVEEEQYMTPDSIGTDALIAELFKRAASKTIKVELGEDTMGAILDILAKSQVSIGAQVENTKEHEWSKVAEPVLSDSIIGIDIDKLVEESSVKKALILSGVPGTGKTNMAFAMAHILTNGDGSRVLNITFGRGTSYSTFIGGIRQSSNGIWEHRDGLFTEFCKKADYDRTNTYVLVIDEISRGNPEEILGEALTGIESRDTVITTVDGYGLLVPSNLYILGTQNISDKSTVKLDRAVYERFTHKQVKPQWTDVYMQAMALRINEEDRPEAYSLMNNLAVIMASNVNDTIEKAIGDRYVIGTRAISTGATTLKQLKTEIRLGLIPIILDRAELLLDDSNKEILTKAVEDIKSWLN